MALSHFHYLVTTFCLTVWTRSPALILSLTWAFQALLFLCGIATPDLNDYVFWQFLTSLAGVLLGASFVLVTRLPQILRARASHATLWIIFFVWLLLFVASQLFFAFFPTPLYPWGLIGTMSAHIILIGSLGAILTLTEAGLIVFRDYLWSRFLFGMWLAIIIIVEAFFFLTYAIASEKWSAYIGCATSVVLLLAVQVSCNAGVSVSVGAYRRHSELSLSLSASTTLNETPPQ